MNVNKNILTKCLDIVNTVYLFYITINRNTEMDNTEKKSKIKSCRFVSEWAGQNGIVYYHEIELDNGDLGQIGTKDKMPDKIQPGQELTYTIEATTRGNKIKAVSAQGGFKGGKPQRDPKEQMISFSMSYCKDLVVAGKLDIKDLEVGTTRIYNIMKKLYES